MRPGAFTLPLDVVERQQSGDDMNRTDEGRWLEPHEATQVIVQYAEPRFDGFVRARTNLHTWVEHARHCGLMVAQTAEGEVIQPAWIDADDAAELLDRRTIGVVYVVDVQAPYDMGEWHAVLTDLSCVWAEVQQLPQVKVRCPLWAEAMLRSTLLGKGFGMIAEVW